MGKNQSFIIIAGVVAVLWIVPWLVRPLGQDIDGSELITAMTLRGVVLLMAFGMVTVIRKHGTLLGVVFLISPLLGAALVALGMGKTGEARRKAKRETHVDPMDVAQRLEALERKRAAAKEAPKPRDANDWDFLESPTAQQPARPASVPVPRQAEPVKRQVAQTKQASDRSAPAPKAQPTRMHKLAPTIAENLRSQTARPEARGIQAKGHAKYDSSPIVSNRGLFGRKSKVI